MITELKECINELCLYCGKYKNEHEGACEGCKWYLIKNGKYTRNKNTMKDCVEDLVFNCELEGCYTEKEWPDGSLHRYANCPFLDSNYNCKIQDPSSWVI